jgi:hypothetical protein
MNRIKHHNPRRMLSLLVLVLITAAPFTVEAQENTPMVRTLVIKNNRVLLDGNEIEQSNLGADGSLEGISVSYSFIGIENPVVTIDGQLYVIEKDKLRAVESRDKNQLVFQKEKRQVPNELQAREAQGWIVDSDRGEYYTFQGERLRSDEAVPRLLNQANALYLEDLQKQNMALFSRLSRERELEVQAEYLVIATRRAQSSEERKERRLALTTKLTEIFELKQQNRKAEIAKFEADLEILRRRVDNREAIKQQIIEERVLRLTGQTK